MRCNKIERIFSYINKNGSLYLDFLKRLTACESYSFDTEGVAEAGGLTASFAEALGFTVEKEHFEKTADGLIIKTAGNSRKSGVVFVAHLDTVHKKGDFPLMLSESNGYLYGPGVVDCKGGIAVALLAMSALKEAGEYEGELKLLLTPDEELSNRLSGEKGIEFIKKNSRGASAAFICECAKNGEAVVSRKGVVKAKISVKGKAAHAGMYYDEGISAIREAAYKIINLEKLSDSAKITYNCGIISGGSAENAIPENCHFTVDARYRNYEEKSEILTELQKAADTSFVKGSVSELEILSTRSPMPENKKSNELFEKLKTIGEKYDLEKLSPCSSGGGSDAAYTAEAGVPSVCGMGMTGFDWHTLNERALCSSLISRAKLLAATISEYSL